MFFRVEIIPMLKNEKFHKQNPGGVSTARSFGKLGKYLGNTGVGTRLYPKIRPHKMWHSDDLPKGCNLKFNALLIPTLKFSDSLANLVEQRGGIGYTRHKSSATGFTGG